MLSDEAGADLAIGEGGNQGVRHGGGGREKMTVEKWPDRTWQLFHSACHVPLANVCLLAKPASLPSLDL